MENMEKYLYGKRILLRKDHKVKMNVSLSNLLYMGVKIKDIHRRTDFSKVTQLTESSRNISNLAELTPNTSVSDR